MLWYLSTLLEMLTQDLLEDSEEELDFKETKRALAQWLKNSNMFK